MTIRAKTINQGFTLLEILIALAIIGLLASVVLLSLTSYRVTGRDGRRLADLNALLGATELYIQDYKSPPAVSSWLELNNKLGKYLENNSLPQDPSSEQGGIYFYCASKHNYLFGALLEKSSDLLNDLDNITYAVSDCVFSGAVEPSYVACLDDGSVAIGTWMTGGPALCLGLDKVN